MKKPAGFDEARAAGEYTPVELGGHHAVIKQVTETKSSTGKDMIVVLFDFAKGDKQEGYFMAAFSADDREEAKWPFNGTKYILVNDYADATKTSRQFKTFCTCVEKSNNYEIKWDVANWEKQFKGKKIGVVFGAEEHEYNGKISMRHIPKFFCRDDKADEACIPEPKFLNGKTPATARTAPPSADSFMNVEEGEEDIPF